MDGRKIGTFIKELRLKNKMSQNSLANEIPIGREAISKWECGRTIPDSSTIMRLSEIFHVSIDEVMYGEYKTNENEKDISELCMKMYDDRNTINKKLKKNNKYLLFIFLLLLITIISFLVYYFFNSYDSVKIYIIESQSNDIYLTDGIIALTGENIYFRLGNINGIDEKVVNKIILYSKKNGAKKIIYESTSTKDVLVRDYYGYNEYFKIKNKDIIFDSLYIDIYYDNKVKTLNLIMKEDYSNKRLFFRKDEKIGEQKSKKDTLTSNEQVDKIKENLDVDDDGIYNKKLKIDELIYNVYYIDNSSSLLILWEKDKKNYSINYSPIYKSAFFNKSDNKSNIIEECYYEENNHSKTTCNNFKISFLNSILNEILKERS